MKCEHNNFDSSTSVSINITPKGREYWVSLTVRCRDCGAVAEFDVKNRPSKVEPSSVTLPLRFSPTPTSLASQDTTTTPPGPPE